MDAWVVFADGHPSALLSLKVTSHVGWRIELLVRA